MNAIYKNFDIIELDIQLCKSCEIIIYHNIHIQDLLITRITLKELKDIDRSIITIEELFKIPGIKKKYIF
jgi:hypothetical protein